MEPPLLPKNIQGRVNRISKLFGNFREAGELKNEYIKMVSNPK